MMFCRAAWQRLAPLARKTLTPLSNAVFPARQMSFGLPVSGTNIAYVVLGGSSLTAALVYAYKTINSDSARYNERIAQIEARSKSEEGAVAEIALVAEAAAVVETTATEEINAEAEQTPEPVEAATTIVEAVAADAEEPNAPVVEDVTAEAAAPIAETTVVPMSDLLSTVKILAGSTAEIAAASVVDQHLVSSVRLAEENNSMETLNGLEAADVKAEVPAEVPEEALIGRLNLKAEENELEELTASLRSVEETIVVAADHVESDADSLGKSLASSNEAIVTEMENILELEDSTSPVVMLSEDDSVSGAAEVTSETVEVGQKMEECKGLCYEQTETEYEGLTEPPADLEESLQTTGAAEAAEDVIVMEMMQDAVEKATLVEASDEADESGNVAVTMTA